MCVNYFYYCLLWPAVPKFDVRHHTHTERLTHDGQWEVTDAVMFFIVLFCARLAWWCRQLAVLSRLQLCLSVDDSRSLCKQLQAVSVIPVCIVYLIMFVCNQKFAKSMAVTLPSTSLQHMIAGSGADSACRNVRTGISIFLINDGFINTSIIPISKKKHFS